MTNRTIGTYCAAGFDARAGLIAKIQVLCTHAEMVDALAAIAGRYAALRSQIEPTDGLALLDRAKALLGSR